MIVVSLGLALTAVLFVIARARKSRSSAKLPPGPRPIPFLGNVLELDTGAPFLTYTTWSKTYGDIVYTQALGQEIIILNSEDVAVELLEKRSDKYSDRPVYFTLDLFGWGWTTKTARYGPRLRLHRQLSHQVFHAKAALTYRPKQIQSAYKMLGELLDNPTHYEAPFTMFSASVVMAVTYGYDMSEGETFVTSMQRATDMVIRFATPEISALCAAFPFIMALPAWFPGMGFKHEATECRPLVSEAVNAPYAWVKRRIAEGNATPCMVTNAITRYGLDDDAKDPELARAIREAAGTLYAASVETTRGTLGVFIYLMMNHPEVQRRAHEDIDRVVGRNRLPDFGDRGSLPYVDAILRETIRWHPVASIGLPHATSEHDVYRGYYIPRGAIVIANTWAISHNERKYPNPDVFTPERFLCDNGTLSEDDIPWAFGFGRRICPGRHVADASLWSAMVCILALFRIEKTEGSDKIEWSRGLTTHPLPFPCKFVPREEGMDAQRLALMVDASRIDLTGSV